MRLINRAAWVALAVWLGSWIYFSRFAMLDDALIHLRYASFLQSLHFVTYDGIHHTYGTSSLLYLSLLAALRNFTTTALLPKAVSTICYLLLIAVLLLLHRRSARGNPSRLVWLGLLFTSLSPMAVRWLTDGMETSLVVLSATLLAWFVDAQGHRKTTGPASYWMALLFGALLVFLRIELISLAFLAACIIIATRLQQVPSRPTTRLVFLHGTALAAGAVLAILGTRLIFGSFLPDTALAKSGSPSIGPLVTAASAIGSSLLLGIGSITLAVLSGALLLRELIKRRASYLEFVAWACANASFPLILVLACARGQAVQGIRYLLWTFYFPIAWNALALNRLQSGVTCVRSAVRYATLGYAALLLLLLPVDWLFAERVMSGRMKTFETMRGEDLSRFQGKQAIAGDIGFIGYFTGADICDLAGLVNGRAAARLPPEQRIERCASHHPQLLFVTPMQAVQVSQTMNLKSWMICQRVDFTNVRTPDSHYLMVPGTAGPHTCPDGSLPVPAGKIISELQK